MELHAEQRQDFTPGYAAELQQWTRRYPAGRDGVPATRVATAPIGPHGTSPLRRFPRSGLDQPRQLPGHNPARDVAELLVVVTEHDEPLDWLRAGDAASAVLLAATGVAAAGAAELPVTPRRNLRSVLLPT
ncbi:MAG: hypothetical protein LH603_06325 [Pseudonocardia sp.]|nr:hypothetical protein [Pseudonocardia sp.]